MKKLRVGTRGSKLATTQTKQTLAVFQEHFPEVEVSKNQNQRRPLSYT